MTSKGATLIGALCFGFIVFVTELFFAKHHHALRMRAVWYVAYKLWSGSGRAYLACV